MQRLLLLLALAVLVGVAAGQMLWGDQILWGTTPQTVVAVDQIVWGD